MHDWFMFLALIDIPYVQELVAKSIESSDLNFSRYGDTFFEASSPFIISLLLSKGTFHC
jgi:hypothetical protein